MKKWILQITLVAALVAAALLMRGGPALPVTPEETIAGFFDAARDGDAKTYLRHTSGNLRRALRQLQKEQGTAGFSRDMQRSLDGIVGQAVKRLPQAPAAMAAFEVELVFTDRNEVQTFLLEQVGSGWAICLIETARVYQPEIAYGTPVFAEPDLLQADTTRSQDDADVTID